jgi:raffinose/stachyose/melibiose transport system substrate-binding protein
MFSARRRRLAAATAGAAVVALTAACSGGSDTAKSPGDASSADKPSGAITVLTNRTDLVDTAFKGYKKTFEAKYPGVTVTFQGVTDYEGEVKTRMNTKDYGDVLLIPRSVTSADLKDFFEPLGTVDKLGQKYRFVNEQAMDGTVYGLATFGNAQGMVYNKKVFAEAGITALPKTTDEFITDLQAIKAKTKAVPLYTNYKDGWPLIWPQNLMGSFTGDANVFTKMSASNAPWTAGQEKYIADSLLYDVAAKGLIEKDPTTTNWENSKNLIATGKIGVMVLGSWALPQMQDAAKTAKTNPADMAFMPAPVQVDGAYQSPVAGDYNMGININSEHKAAARAWIDWIINDSGYYELSGGLATLKDKPAPATLKDFEATGVKYVETIPSAKLTVIDKGAEVGLADPIYYRKLVDSARGASKQTKQQIFDELNSKWAASRAQVG